MELNDEIRISAPRERVFAALNDVEILKQAIPGCEDMQALSDTEFTATITSKVGPLKARFNGSVTLSDIVAPESYTLAGEGKGGPAGHAKITSKVRLVEDGDATVMHYDVKADIGGKLAQLGGHLVQKTAQKLAVEFFQRFEEILNPADDATPGAQPEPDPEGGSTTWPWICGAALMMIVIVWLAL